MGSMNQLFGGGNPSKWVSGTYTEGAVVWSPSDYQYYMNKTTGARATDPASDPTNWQPTGDRAIKSIQRGVISFGASVSATAIVSSVVTAKTELRYLGNVGSGTAGDQDPYLALTNSTTITATKGNANSTSTAVSWELTERF